MFLPYLRHVCKSSHLRLHKMLKIHRTTLKFLHLVRKLKCPMKGVIKWAILIIKSTKSLNNQRITKLEFLFANAQK